MVRSYPRWVVVTGALTILTAAGSAAAQTPSPSAAAPRGATPPASAAPLPALPPPAAPGTYPPPPNYPPQPGYAQPGAAPPGGYAAQPGYPAQSGYPPAPPPPAPEHAQAAQSEAPQLPAEMRYVEGRNIPPGYHLETRARRGLVITGPILFGIPYTFSLSSAASSAYSPDRWLYMPVLGPFIDLASRGDRCTRSGQNFSSPGVTFTTDSCNDDGAARFFLMMDGIIQTAGATMLILGLALPQHVMVRDNAPFSSDGWTFAWTVRPQRLGRSAYGLGIDGTF
jgi:hypothetical protein